MSTKHRRPAIRCDPSGEASCVMLTLCGVSLASGTLDKCHSLIVTTAAQGLGVEPSCLAFQAGPSHDCSPCVVLCRNRRSTRPVTLPTFAMVGCGCCPIERLPFRLPGLAIRFNADRTP